MKKTKYYKAMFNRKEEKKWYSESWGEPLKIILPNGKIFYCACEYRRIDGWRITDISTGYLAQNKYIFNKTELKKYINSEDYLKALERNTEQEHYKQAQETLNEYKLSLANEVSNDNKNISL